MLEKELDGKVEWKPGNWCDIAVAKTEDKENWYYKNGNVIYVQPKSFLGNPNSPYCYGCGSKIVIIKQECSVRQKNALLSVKEKEEKPAIKFIPYCPKCEPKPSESVIIDK